MAMTLEELEKSLKYGSYTPLTEEQIQQQAKDKYQAELDQSKLTAQQAYDKTALALDDQRSKLDAAYAQQEESMRKNTAKTYSAADRHALTRGMQRSTYNNSTLANINLQGDEALNELAASLRADQQSIDSQKTQAAEQLAQQLAQYEANNHSQVAAYADELREKDYQKKTAQEQYYNELQTMLYELGLKDTSNKSSSSGTNPPKDNTDSKDTDSKDADADKALYLELSKPTVTTTPGLTTKTMPRIITTLQPKGTTTPSPAKTFLQQASTKDGATLNGTNMMVKPVKVKLK